MTIDEATFESLAAATLQRFAQRIEDAADDLDVELEEGILTVETPDGATYLINKHAPLRQIWLSSPISGAGHFGYRIAPVAQLDRASASGAEGHRFESCRARQP